MNEYTDLFYIPEDFVYSSFMVLNNGVNMTPPFFLSFADLFKYLLKTQTVIKQHRLLRSPRDRPVPQFVTLWVLVKSQKSQKLCENN